MVEVSCFVAAPPERVWAQLSDGWIFSGWVVGASHIRDVDVTWPHEGARLYHQVGSWPLVVEDTTSVVTSEVNKRLELQARAWPFGEARVVLELTAEGDGTTVTMREWPTRGPGRFLPNPLQSLMLKARNKESLARLASLAERRPEPKTV